MANIDPKTGERIPDNSSQIDPLTGERVGPAPKAAAPSATMTTVPPESWLHQAEEDLTQGGNRTVLGRIGGTMQGRGDKGFSGIDSGVSKGTANLMGSPELGLLHAGEAAQTIPDHPVKGVLGTIGGALEAAKLPGMVMAGPEAEMGLGAIPLKSHAVSLFNDIEQAAKNVPVQMSKTAPALEDFGQTVATGGRNAGVMTKLTRRIDPPAPRMNMLQSMQSDLSGAAPSAPPDPINFPEARDFYTNISRQTAKPGLLRRAFEPLSMPSFRMNAGNVREALGSDLTDAAGTIGRGEDYTNAMREYRQAAQLNKALKVGGTIAAGEALRRSGLLGQIASGTMKVAQ
jgi:hypothetical protein